MSGLVREHPDIAHLRGTGEPDSADAYEVTALAASPFGAPIAVSPARAPRATKRASVDWSEPEPWIIAVLLVTGVAVIGRHPIARAIGTEVDDTTLTPSVVASAPPTAAPAAGVPAAIAAPVPTHAPRNPFHALVQASGGIIAPDLGQALTSTTTVPRHVAKPAASKPAALKPAVSKPSAPALASATCAGTMHTVVAGDTLWTLAAKIVKSNDTAAINVEWHRIYKNNATAVGSNPSLLPVGAKLCLPTR